jgi:hypothetical protein
LDLLKASLPPSSPIIFVERARVYRDLQGGYIKDAPLEVFDTRWNRLRVEHWSYGKLHGPWIDWDPKGTELARGEYWQGLEHGEWLIHAYRRMLNQKTRTVYDRGTRVEREVFLRGVLISRVRRTSRNGASWEHFERWYPDGSKQSDGQRRDGLEMGEWKFWNPDGSLAGAPRFQDGRLILPNGALTPPILAHSPETDSPAERRIREAVGEIAMLEFIRTPLSEVAEYLEDAHNIPILLNEKKIHEAGRFLDTRITFALEGASLRAALQFMLYGRGLAPVVRREVMLFTALEDAAGWRDQTGLPEILAGTNAELVQSLQAIANCRFKEMPLREVLNYFRYRESIPIRFEEGAFANRAGLLEEPVTLHLRGVSRAAVLGFVLDDHALTCVEQNGELWVKPRR